MSRKATLLEPPRFVLAEHDEAGVRLESDTGAVVHLICPHEGVIRLVVLPDGRMRQPRTWAIAPGLPDVPDEGRDRFDLQGFTPPGFDLIEQDGVLIVTSGALQATVALNGLHCAWAVREADGAWREVVRDRETQAYDWGWWDGRPRHHLARREGDRVFGLGERSGEMDRTGRRFRLSNIDAMGYDAAITDPLYKHIPFFIVREPQGACLGLFYDTLSDCEFDFGQELDNYHGLYRSFTAEHGDLDLWITAGPSIAEVVRRFTWLTGRPARVPRWSLGYSGSTMTYTDAPNAQARMQGFLDKLAEHDLPCSSFHLSSGYTSIGDKRYVFHWNHDKFPDPKAFAASYAAAGVRLIANIKPALLRDHPRFAEAQAAGLLICDIDGEPAWVQFWDEVGAYLDFTNPATTIWWKAQVTSALLDQGIASTWNDNNEWEIWSDRAIAHGFGAPRPARETRAVQPLLMMRASRAAQLDHAPDSTPFLVTRSGCVGMHRYAQTWSGDNYTRWETLRLNQYMALGLALSGVSNTGHDVGGFSGPAPDMELFVRWVQANILMPRFSVHSWNDDGTVNELWMYPEAIPTLRRLLELRGWLSAYIYDALADYAETFAPVISPLFHHFPEDPSVWDSHDEYMLGPNLLLAPVLDPGLGSRRLALPTGAKWIDLWTGHRHVGGSILDVEAPLDAYPPVFLRCGRGLGFNPTSRHAPNASAEAGFLLALSGREERFSAVTRLGDGEQMGAADPQLAIDVAAGADLINASVSGATGLLFSLTFAAPEHRKVELDGATVVEESVWLGRLCLWCRCS